MSTSSGAYPHGADGRSVIVRPALPSDARRIYEIVEPYAQERILIAKELISYFEGIQEFLVGELPRPDGTWHVVGCGALHVLWDDIARCAPWRWTATTCAAGWAATCSPP